MRIGIEGQRLFRKKKHGMDIVALELIKNLQEIDHDNEYFIFVKKDEDPCLNETPNFKIIELPDSTYPVWEQFLLPKAAVQAGCDLLHCTSNTAPVRSRIPLIVTVHDIIYMEKLSLFRKGFSAYQKFGNVYRRWNVPICIKRSKCVITVSEFEKQRIASFFHIDDKKLKAVYNGVGQHFKQISDTKLLTEIRTKYKLPDKFFFFFGNTDPKKNTKGVLKALSLFNQGSIEKIPLVMLDYDKKELAALIQQIGDPALTELVRLTGYVPNSELPAIYSLATIFLYPSLRESFGIPMLEAMACGVPVITSNTSSMPEVGADAAYYIDPYHPEQITEAIATILSNDALRKDLIEKGFRNAKKYSWRAMAEHVLSLYQSVSQES